MKILYLIPNLRKGGAERYALDLCLELNRRPEIEYKLLVFEDKNDYEYLTGKINYQKLDRPFVPSVLRKNYVNVEQYKKIIEDFKPDIIHTHLFLSEIFTSIYVPENIAFVVHGHDNMPQFKNLALSSFLKKSLLTNFYEKRILVNKKYKKNKNTYFIANSPDTLEYFQKTVPAFLRKNVRIIEYGFDFDRFYFPLKSSADRNEKFSIVNIGSFAKKKNQKFIVEIAKVLKDKGFEFEINLLGAGECQESVENQIREYGLAEKVFMRGNVDFVEKYLRHADLYLHTAYYEPFGLVLLEAMAAGLPCVILDGKGNRNIVRDDYNGYLFFEQNAEIFAGKIMELAENESLYKTLSKNAQEFAETYDISTRTNELIDFYESIIVK